MANKDEPESTSPPAARAGRRLWMAFLAVGLAAAAGTAALAWWGVVPLGPGSAEAETADRLVTRTTSRDPIYVPLDPPFTVNFERGGSARFLQVSVEVLTRETEVETAIGRHMPAIRNSLVFILGGQSADELNTRGGKERLQDEILGAIRDLVGETTPPDGVEAVFFTSFVMQ